MKSLSTLNVIISALLAAAVLSGCSSNYRGQNRVQKDTVLFPGGVYKEKSWDDTLKFKRTSFYVGAKLYHDVLVAKLDKDSPFRNWLGSAQKDAEQCNRFYVVMVYRDLVGSVSRQKVFRQIERPNLQTVYINDFSDHLREHFITDQLHFKAHRIRGFCHTGMGDLEALNINLPGFQEVNLLK